LDTLVCVKAVTREPPRPREEGGEVGFERIGSGSVILNESDSFAVDQAVLLKKGHPGRVTAVTVGPLAAQDVLYSSLAKGADEALRIDADGADAMAVARILAAVAREGSYDLVLTGVESNEDLASAVPPALAARLDLPFATSVSRIEVTEAGERLVVGKEMGGGFFQTLEMPLPAVLAVQSGICRLRYPPTIRVLQARRQRIRGLSPRELGFDAATGEASLVSVSTPPRERESELIDGTPAEIAGALLDRIEEVLVPR
jgi:electron transfer flavoprotein beta subunit